MTNSGFSIIETMLSGTILAVLIAFNLEIFQTTQKADKASWQQGKGLSFESTVADELGIIAIKMMTPDPEIEDLCEESIAKSQLSKALASHDDFFKFNLPSSPAVLPNAMKKSMTFPISKKGIPLKFQITPKPGVEIDFLTENDVFVQAFYGFWDGDLNKPTTCKKFMLEDYQHNVLAGHLYYSLFWRPKNKNSQKINPKSEDGFFTRRGFSYQQANLKRVEYHDAE